MSAAGFRSPAKVLRRLRYLPAAVRTIRNWPRFIWNYALGLPYGGVYNFRSGGRMKIGRAIDHVPIIEIFFNADYGDISDNSVIIDLGANIGAFSVYATTTAQGVAVYAYEPFRGYYELLLENAALNSGRGTVTAFNEAVAGDQGSRELFTTGEALFFPTLVEPEKSSGSVSVPCTTLAAIIDANGLQRVDMLKLDCEGAEYEILYATPPPYFQRIIEIRMEYHNLPGENANAGALESFLTGRGYEIIHRKTNTPTNGCLWARRHDPRPQ